MDTGSRVVLIILGIFQASVFFVAGSAQGQGQKVAELVKVCMDKNPKMAHTEVKNYCLEYIGEKTK